MPQIKKPVGTFSNEAPPSPLRAIGARERRKMRDRAFRKENMEKSKNKYIDGRRSHTNALNKKIDLFTRKRASSNSSQSRTCENYLLITLYCANR